MNRFLLIFIVVCTGCVASKDPQRKAVRELQKGSIKDDTSYIYSLPYETGSSHLIVQGYYGAFSHKRRMAIDFKMKKGAKITAARDGIVVRAVESNNRGGWSRKNRQYANYVVIEHADGTRAGYWHLQKNGVLVNIGDSVKQGQVIGLNGRTGFSAFPHLHFLVWGNKDGQWQQLPTRFHTRKGPKYLQPFKRYKK